MNFVEQSPPPAVQRVLRLALRRRLQRRFSGHTGLTISTPHPCYGLSLEAVEQGRGLEAARMVSWRLLLRGDSGPVAAVEVARPGPDQLPQILSVHTGPFLAHTLEGIRQALADVSLVGRYTLRLVKVPGVSFAALWLSGEPDVLIPLADLDGLPMFVPVAPEDALALLRPLATAQRGHPVWRGGSAP